MLKGKNLWGIAASAILISSGLAVRLSREVYVKNAKHLLSMATIVLLVNVLALPAHSGVLTFNETTGGSGTNANQTVGWEFNVLSPITVDDLE